MPQDTFSVDIARNGGVVVVRVRGELDLVSVPELQLALDGVDGGEHVVIDFGGVSFMDSTGLNLIVQQWNRMESSGGSLRLRHVAFPVRHVVEMTGLIQLLQPDDS
jgi:anti-anti-sigma factor